MTRLSLTERALRDLADIRAYSTVEWGQEVAEDYLDAFEGALRLLQQHPELLRS
ncbi:MAG: type II toxin-antitoxin system RelE/ParE family toxin [Puniceicoccales bacterium]